MNANDLEERLIHFGVRCSLLCRELPLEFYDAKHVASQLIRAATHPGFHYPEARSAESDRDFLHKLKVLLKELRESHAELKYIKYMNYFETDKVDALIKESDELVAIFIATTKKVANKINSKK